MEEAFRINQKTKKTRNDCAVQGTNDSAVLSKISMSTCGYFDDNFLKYFACKSARRSPLINRGYYIRAKTIDYVFKSFLNTINGSQQKQVINLGAGFDSTFFRLKNLNQLNDTLFIEIDFPDVISRKINLINANESLLSLCPDLVKVDTFNDNFVYKSVKSNYVLIGLDMRDTRLFEAILKSIDLFNDTNPTLLLSEVVLTYMAVNRQDTKDLLLDQDPLKNKSIFVINCILAIYEQITPYDAFGQVMCNHFIKLGSPLKCIYKYPTLKSQVERHVQLGLNECKGIRIIDFYNDHISNDDKSLLNALEPFDEFEEWQLKCTHYGLILGSNGAVCTELVQQIIGNNQNSSFDSNHTKTIDLTVTEFPLLFGCRFGHSIHVDKQNRKLYIIGGFGESLLEKGRHRRLNTIEIVCLNTMTVQVIDYLGEFISDRIHSTSSLVNDKLLILYGRGSPDRPINLALISKNDDGETYFFDSLKLNDDQIKPKLRWRHASCNIDDSNVLIVGGRSFNHETQKYETLGDIFLFSNLKEFIKIDVDVNVFKSRHSHSICKWNDTVIVSGGLDDNENLIDEIALIDLKSFQIKKLDIETGRALPRYSHTSHVIDNNLVLVGGVNHNNKQPGLCIIDLEKLIANEFELPAKSFDDSPLMLQNHQSLLLDKNRLLVIGGGGNCFSFGTHINKKPVLIDITKCWEFF